MAGNHLLSAVLLYSVTMPCRGNLQESFKVSLNTMMANEAKEQTSFIVEVVHSSAQQIISYFTRIYEIWGIRN